MKKSVLALAFALAIPSFAFASAPDAAQLPVIEHADQVPGPHGEHKGDHKGEHGKRGPGYDHGFKQIKKELALTDEQSKVVKEASTTEMRAHFDIVQKYLDKLPAEDQAAMKKEHEAAAQLRRDEILKTLNPEQRVKAEAVFDRQKAQYEKFRTDHEKPKS